MDRSGWQKTRAGYARCSRTRLWLPTNVDKFLSEHSLSEERRIPLDAEIHAWPHRRVAFSSSNRAVPAKRGGLWDNPQELSLRCLRIYFDNCQYYIVIRGEDLALSLLWTVAQLSVRTCRGFSRWKSFPKKARRSEGNRKWRGAWRCDSFKDFSFPAKSSQAT